MNLSPETLARLLIVIESKAAESCVSAEDDFNAYDYSGGNYDDAFYMGTRDGERYFACELLNIINENKGT